MRRHFLFLLLALILIAVILIPNSTVRELIFSSGRRVVLSGDLLRRRLARFFGIDQELERLMAQNAVLRSELASGASGPSTKVFDSGKLISAKVVFVDRIQAVPARLVLKVIDGEVISGGDLVVLSDNTLVGVIERIEGGYAAVKTVMSSDLDVLVLGQESQAQGVLEGGGISGSFLRIRSSPASPDFRKGEAVVSAGMGSVPRGLNIGMVGQAKPSVEGAFKITFLIPFFSVYWSEPLFVLPRSSFPLILRDQNL